MKKLVALAMIMTSSVALADGFKCDVLGSGLNIKVYNHTNPEMGTRTPAVMVLSDSEVETVGRKTIAVFKDSKTISTDAGMKYVGKVDLRFKNSNRKGENLLGTKLGHLKTITLDLDFSYASPVESGDLVDANVIAVKRNGTVIERQAICERYLKN